MLVQETENREISKIQRMLYMIHPREKKDKAEKRNIKYWEDNTGPRETSSRKWLLNKDVEEVREGAVSLSARKVSCSSLTKTPSRCLDKWPQFFCPAVHHLVPCPLSHFPAVEFFQR